MHYVFDEMPSQQEAGMGGVLHVTVCHLLYDGQVTEEMQVQVHEGTNRVVALFAFPSLA